MCASLLFKKLKERKERRERDAVGLQVITQFFKSTGECLQVVNNDELRVHTINKKLGS